MTNNTEVTVTQAEFLQAIRRREVQMQGAAISLRNWHDMEVAYNALRDKIDAELIRLNRLAQHRTRSVGEGDVKHLAHILEEWDMKPPPHPTCGHAYEDIARDALARLHASPKPNDSVDAVREADWPSQAEWDSHTQEERLAFLNRHYAALSQPAGEGS